MNSSAKLLLLLSPVLALLAFVAPPAARAMDNPHVQDDAGFFSPDAVSKADAVIKQIKQDHGEELMIETYTQIPADRRGQYNAANKAQFFEQWANQRAQELRLRGVFVLICRDPSTLRVVIGDQTAKKAFTVANREKLSQTLLASFKTKDFDQGLLNAVEYARQTFDENLGPGGKAQAPPAAGGTSGTNTSASSPPPSRLPPPVNLPGRSSSGGGGRGLGFGTCFVIGFLIIGLFIVIRIVRGIFGRRSYGPGYGAGGYGPGASGPGPYGYGGGGGGGGGFGTGLLGGLLGGMLGGYAQDRWSHRNDPGAPPLPPADSGGGGIFHEPSGPSFDQGETFTGGSSGGDFGGGGGDLGGGGDAGGGGGGGGSSGGDF